MVRKLSKRLNSKSLSKRLKSKRLSKRLKSKRLSKRKKMSIQKGGDHAEVYLIASGDNQWAIASPGQAESIKDYTTELSKGGTQVGQHKIRTIFFNNDVNDQIFNNETQLWHLIFKVEIPAPLNEFLAPDNIYATNTLTDLVYISDGDPV